jgi:hypothetical protein
VIDDKARVGAEAARSEPLAVAVAGQDEDGEEPEQDRPQAKQLL